MKPYSRSRNPKLGVQPGIGPTSASAQPRQPGHARRSAWLLSLCGALAALASAAGETFEPETRALLVEAVEAAAAVDHYHGRCRGDISGRHTDNLNKLLVGKLRITVLSVEDDLFPERSYRRAQERMSQEHQRALRDAGGCQQAKGSGLADELRRRFEEKLEAIRALP